MSVSHTQSALYYTGQCCPLYHESATFDPILDIYKLQRAKTEIIVHPILSLVELGNKSMTIMEYLCTYH